AVLVSPAFSYHAIPTALSAGAMNYYTLMPNTFTWWDETLKDRRPPDYAYPRYSTRALVQWMRLGFAVQASARSTPPGANSILLVTNGLDTSGDNQLSKEVASLWQAHGAVLRTYEFDGSLHLPHDLIDPTKDPQNTSLVQPKMVELVTQ